MTFFPGQKKPRSAKGSFQNYGDHLCYLGEEADAVYKKLKPLETKGKLGLLIKEATAR